MCEAWGANCKGWPCHNSHRLPVGTYYSLNYQTDEREQVPNPTLHSVSEMWEERQKSQNSCGRQGTSALTLTKSQPIAPKVKFLS